MVDPAVAEYERVKGLCISQTVPIHGATPLPQAEADRIKGLVVEVKDPMT